MNEALALKAIACFVIGSVPFAVVAMWGSGVDIRQIGSGNPGFNNVLRVSKPRAVLALIGDVGKGYLPVWLFLEPADPLVFGWLYGFAAVFGHCYSPLLKFRGGKGVATSAGVMLVLFPKWAAISLAVFVFVRLLGGRRRWSEAGMIASLATWSFFTASMIARVGGPHDVNAALMTVFLAWRHRQNFRNVLGSRD